MEEQNEGKPGGNQRDDAEHDDKDQLQDNNEHGHGHEDHGLASKKLSELTDPNDIKKWKRIMANRRSARESRERKKAAQGNLERMQKKLTEENAQLLRENESLRQQISLMLELNQREQTPLPQPDQLVSPQQPYVCGVPNAPNPFFSNISAMTDRIPITMPQSPLGPPSLGLSMYPAASTAPASVGLLPLNIPSSSAGEAIIQRLYARRERNAFPATTPDEGQS